MDYTVVVTYLTREWERAKEDRAVAETSEGRLAAGLRMRGLATAITDVKRARGIVGAK